MTLINFEETGKLILKKYFFIFTFFILLALSSCSTTKQINKSKQQKLDSNAVVHFHKDIQSLYCEGEIEINASNQDMSGNFELTMIRDSVILLDIFGPFGINVARIYSSVDSIYVYNLWSRKYYANYQKLDGFEFLTPFVSKFFSFIIAEPFYSTDTLKESDLLRDTVSFSKRITENEDYDFTYLRHKKSTLNLTYKYNGDIYNADFTKFAKSGNFELPYKIVIFDIASNNKMVFNINEFKDLNKNFTINNTIKDNFRKVDSFQELY